MNGASTAPVALVTGGSRGIGGAVGVELARRGHCVAIAFQRDVEAAETASGLVRSLGRSALAVRADVSRAEDVRELFHKVDDWMGRLDVLVCSAGIARDALLAASSADDFASVL